MERLAQLPVRRAVHAAGSHADTYTHTGTPNPRGIAVASDSFDPRQRNHHCALVRARRRRGQATTSPSSSDNKPSWTAASDNHTESCVYHHRSADNSNDLRGRHARRQRRRLERPPTTPTSIPTLVFTPAQTRRNLAGEGYVDPRVGRRKRDDGLRRDGPRRPAMPTGLAWPATYYSGYVAPVHRYRGNDRRHRRPRR